jgi:hypothetical protein
MRLKKFMGDKIKKRLENSRRFSDCGKQLTFRELEVLACTRLTAFLTFFSAAVTREETGLLENATEFRIVFFNRTGETVGNRTGLAVAAAAVNANANIERAFETGNSERERCRFRERFREAVDFERLVVDDDFTRAGRDTNACGGGFTAANGNKNRNVFIHE